MSLKTFHVVFVTLSTLLATGFGVWCFKQHVATGSDLYTLAGALSFMAGGGMVLYGVIFLRKFKRIGFM